MTNEEFIKSVSLEGEEWRDVVGYEGLYMVSSEGRIVSLSREMFNGHVYFISKPNILKQTLSTTGYHYVTLRNNGISKKRKVHRLVATAFIPNQYNKCDVDHINTIRTDNRISNLRWATRSENNLNPISNKKVKDSLKGRTVWNSRKIVQILNNEVLRICDSSRQFMKYGFSQSAVIQCCLKRKESHKGYSFMYFSDYEALTNKSKNAC